MNNWVSFFRCRDGSNPEVLVFQGKRFSPFDIPVLRSPNVVDIYFHILDLISFSLGNYNLIILSRVLDGIDNSPVATISFLFAKCFKASERFVLCLFLNFLTLRSMTSILLLMCKGSVIHIQRILTNWLSKLEKNSRWNIYHQRAKKILYSTYAVLSVKAH